MATTSNVLHQFSTYSYHHFLVLCANTDVAEQLALSNDLANYSQSNPKYQVRDVNEYPEIVLNGNDSPYSQFSEHSSGYVVLIDGRTDTEFSITSAKWTNMLMPNTTGGIEYITTMAVEGQLQIIEPKGIRFLNTISNSIRKLAIDPASAVYLLKTIFVGYRDDGSVEVISNIKPLIFVGYDIKANFDFVGASYTFSFIGMSNGAAKLPHVNIAGERVNVSISNGASLYQAIKTFEKELNSAYTTFFQEAQAQLPSNVKAKPLRYEILVEEPYTSNAYVIDNLKETISDEGHANSTTPMNFGKHSTVESCINRILECCSKVVDEKNSTEDSNQRTAYKVLSTVKTSKTEHLVRFKISQYQMPTKSAISKILSSDPTAGTPNEILQLNYFFTGKNVDILEMDINMAMGLSILQLMHSTDTLTEGTDEQQPSKYGTNSSPGAAIVPAEESFEQVVTIYFGAPVTTPTIREKKSQMSLAKYKSMLKRYSALEGLETKVKIVGNPIFLHNLTRMPSDFDKPTGEIDNEKTPFANFEKIPAFCTIDIKMPSEENSNQYETFWYDGYYFILSVDNMMEDGLFTQELSMMSIPQDLEDNNNEDTNQ